VFYWLLREAMRIVFFWTYRIRRHRIDLARREGGYLMACAHVSHLDPFCLGAVWPRKIGWMARIEFYRSKWSARWMRWFHAFPVNRQGVPVSAIREALARLERGEIVGVFPEGEIMAGPSSVLHGGKIKRGICLLAARSGKPVLPCIVLGAESVKSVTSYLPVKRGRLWVACGDFIEPRTGPDRRAARAAMAGDIEQAIARLYTEARERWQLPG